MTIYNAADMESTSVVIANGDKISSLANLKGKRLCAIKMPGAWTTGTLSLYSSPSGAGSADALPVYNGETGAQVTFQVAANRWVEVPLGVGYSIRDVALYSSSAQGADRTLVLYFREV